MKTRFKLSGILSLMLISTSVQATEPTALAVQTLEALPIDVPSNSEFREEIVKIQAMLRASDSKIADLNSQAQYISALWTQERDKTAKKGLEVQLAEKYSALENKKSDRAGIVAHGNLLITAASGTYRGVRRRNREISSRNNSTVCASARPAAAPLTGPSTGSIQTQELYNDGTVNGQ